MTDSRRGRFHARRPRRNTLPETLNVGNIVQSKRPQKASPAENAGSRIVLRPLKLLRPARTLGGLRALGDSVSGPGTTYRAAVMVSLVGETDQAPPTADHRQDAVFVQPIAETPAIEVVYPTDETPADDSSDSPETVLPAPEMPLLEAVVATPAPISPIPITEINDSQPTASTTSSRNEPMAENGLSAHQHAAIDKLGAARKMILDQLAQVIVGQSDVIEELLISLFSRGHCMLEGVPGLAKTLMVSTLSRTLNLSFSRIQFTPDLMPADITGTEVIQEDRATGVRDFRFLEGPLFANIILADEINRTPPKTQAALLEAMQERQVTVGRTRHVLADPFFVLATQNPIEQEGTYPLPEAQQDRFMFKVFVKYPNFNEEFEVASRTTTVLSDNVQAVLSGEEILALQQIVRAVPVHDHLIRYAVSLVRQTRVGEPGVPDFINDTLQWGAGPRAVQFLILGAKSRALLHGRDYVTCEDVAALAVPVLRHRLVLRFEAITRGITADDVVQHLVQNTPMKEDELTADVRFQRLFAS